MKAAILPDRGVVKVAGADALKFLDGLITADVDEVTVRQARYAALLMPQGKIIADFIVVKAEEDDHFFLDCPRALVPTLVQRLNFYKLRAKVIVEDLSETLGVLAMWDGASTSGPGLSYADPRLSALGLRCMISTHIAAKAASELGATLVDAAGYEAHRIALGVPRGGLDFIYNDAFPHEADMDQLGGVDFEKGCFVGQEVVSRMEHRGTARTRVVPVAFDGPPPEAGVAVTAGNSTLGMMGSGSSAVGRGLATLRLDRVADAMASETPMIAGGITIRPVKPDWARFQWPGEAKAAE
ncbi:MAG: folate-binding protein [Rhizobiales bacterium]|nr:folate-binding protein [Hyphomicrobiales bacterium]